MKNNYGNLILKWAKMINESSEEIISESNDKSLFNLSGKNWKSVEKDIIENCFDKFLESNDNNYGVSLYDEVGENGEDLFEFVVRTAARYHKGSYSYNADSDYEYYGYPEASTGNITVDEKHEEEMKKWLNDRGLAFEFDEDDPESEYEVEGNTAIYTDKFIGHLHVIDKEKAQSYANSFSK